MKHKSIATLCCLLILLLALLCAGCQSGQGSADSTLSSETPSMLPVGLNVANGDIKESGAIFEDGPVTFQDPVTEEMLRNLIGKPEGEVLRSDLQAIHAIYWRLDTYWSDLQSQDGNLPVPGNKREGTWIHSGNPTSLADLALCDNLQWMEFGEIELPSLEPLMGLTQLEFLGFSSTVVSEERLAELARLPALKGLQIDFRATSDYKGQTTGADFTGDGSFILPLARQLTYLDIDNRLTWDPEVLAQLQNLELLSLEAPQDLSFLPSLTNLQKLLLSNCAVSDWNNLQEAENLRHIMLIKCSGVSVEDLAPLEHLAYLDLVMTEFTPKQNRREIAAALPNLQGLSIQ